MNGNGSSNGTGTISKRRVLPSQLQRGSQYSVTKIQQSSQPTPPTGNGAFIVLLPLNDTFEPKTILLPSLPDVVRIGRQTNKSTSPQRDNGFFDSKVLSRAHAELWANGDGRACIKDIRSSNGTFVNGIRLSKENEESEVRELLPGDTLELGIDILNDDNGTIIHRKVSARVDHAGYMTENYGQGSTNSRNHYTNGSQNTQSQQFGGNSGMYENARSGSNTSLSSMASGQSHMTLSRNNVTIDMVLKKLSNDLKISKQVSDDIKHTTEVFKSGLMGSSASSGQPLSPFRQFQLADLVERAEAPSNGDTIPTLQRTTSVKSISDDPLSSQLTSVRLELEMQNARVQELESTLLHEREARMLIEEKWRTMVDVKPSSSSSLSSMDSDNDSIHSSSSTVGPESGSDVPRGTDEVSEVNGGGVVERLENLLRSAQEEISSWRTRAEVAEREGMAKSSRILELLADLHRLDPATAAATTTTDGSSTDKALPEGDASDVSVVPSTRDDDTNSKAKTDKKKAALSATGSAAAAAAAAATPRQRDGTALVSMVGIVMLGIGLMTFLNDYGARRD